MGSAPHGARRVLAYVSSLLSRCVQAATRVQLGDWRHLVDTHVAVVVYRLPIAMGPARHVGCSGGYQHDGVHTGIWTRGEIRVAWRRGNRIRNPASMVRVARVVLPVHHRHFHGDPLLACPQGRRHQWTALIGG